MCCWESVQAATPVMCYEPWTSHVTWGYPQPPSPARLVENLPPTPNTASGFPPTKRRVSRKVTSLPGTFYRKSSRQNFSESRTTPQNSPPHRSPQTPHPPHTPPPLQP